MKKIYLSFLFLLCFFLYQPVYARDGHTKELISIEEEGGVSIDTGDIYYYNVSFQTKQFKDKLDKIHFDLVRNQTEEERPYSVSILLFDENKKNIGFISYCSSRELDGDYALLKLKAGASSKLDIYLKKDYFVTGKGPSYLKYFSILDSNLDCKKYAVNKYEGLTIEEILKGKVSSNYQERFPKLMEFLQKYNMKTFLLTVIGVIALYLVMCAVQNLLYKKMFVESNALSFIPGINLCFIVSLSFGPIVGVLYSLLLVLSIVLWIFVHNSIMFYILFGISIPCFIFNIVKLITKRYGLCYFDPFKHSEDSPMYNWKERPTEPVYIDEEKQNEILDLGYDKDDVSNQIGSYDNSGFSLEDLNHDGVVDETDEKIARNVIDYNNDGVINEMDASVAAQKVSEETDEDEESREEFMRLFK